MVCWIFWIDWKISYICCGSSKSYSPWFLSDAYNPSRERKSGIPHETPIRNGRKNMNNKESQKRLDILMPAPVNIKMRCDLRMSSTALSIVLYCGNLSRCRRLANMIRDVQQLKISAHWCVIATRRKYVIVVGRRSWSSGHWGARIRSTKFGAR